MTKSTGCKGSYSLMKLMSHDPIKQTVPDAMHTIKDAVVNVFELLIGKDDTIKCRKCEFNNGKRFGITEASLEAKISRSQPGWSQNYLAKCLRSAMVTICIYIPAI